VTRLPGGTDLRRYRCFLLEVIRDLNRRLVVVPASCPWA